MGARAHVTEERYLAIQSAWREAAQRLATHDREMRSKYGSVRWELYASRTERVRLERLRAREQRAEERMYALLDTTPAGERWRSGVGCPFVYREMTYAQAMAERPVLPASAIGYGSDRRSVWFTVAA